MTLVKYHCFNSVKNAPNFLLQIVLPLGPAPSIRGALLPAAGAEVGGSRVGRGRSPESWALLWAGPPELFIFSIFAK